jgi:hypothetical protein
MFCCVLGVIDFMFVYVDLCVWFFLYFVCMVLRYVISVVYLLWGCGILVCVCLLVCLCFLFCWLSECCWC